MRYTKKLPYTDLAVQAWYYYFNRSGSDDVSQARIDDCQAAESALKKIDAEHDGLLKTKLLRMVYGVPRRDSVGSRVLCAALDICVSEATAWGWLRRANQYWAEARGVA